ncbi:MAG: ABC transporter ATP-binding protein [Patescibacteria group bacterium]
MSAPEINKDTDEDSGLSFTEVAHISQWVLKTIFRLQKAHAITYLLFNVVYEVRFILNTFIVAKLIDTVATGLIQKNLDYRSLYFYLSALFVYNIVSMGMSHFRSYFQLSLRISSYPKLQKEYYSHLYKLGIEKLEDPEIVNKTHRASPTIESLFDYFLLIISFISMTVRLISVILTVFAIFPLFLLLVVVANIPYFFIDRKYRLLIWKFIIKNTENNRRNSSNIAYLTTPRELHEVYVNNAFEFLSRKYLQFAEWYKKANLEIQKKWYVFNFSALFLPELAVLIGLVNIFKQAISGLLSVGQLTFYFRMLNEVSEGIQTIMNQMNALNSNVLRLKDLYFIFTKIEPFEDGAVAMPRLVQGPQIEFKDVSFAYPRAKTNVFNNINLLVRPKEKIAIVGHNGAGKTTLLKLICRFYKVGGGAILINGTDISSLRIKDWYQNMGVLLQDYNAYGHLTVRENILIGRPDEDSDETAIHLAAQGADALSFINDFQGKFDQVLSERYKGGIRPSTGQWQKIAIARLFYRNPSLVIFDEPTSSIDAVSEYNIFNRIYEFFEGKLNSIRISPPNLF